MLSTCNFLITEGPESVVSYITNYTQLQTASAQRSCVRFSAKSN